MCLCGLTECPDFQDSDHGPDLYRRGVVEVLPEVRPGDHARHNAKDRMNMGMAGPYLDCLGLPLVVSKLRRRMRFRRTRSECKSVLTRKTPKLANIEMA